jgi:hypothetical protein
MIPKPFTQRFLFARSTAKFLRTVFGCLWEGMEYAPAS